MPEMQIRKTSNGDLVIYHIIDRMGETVILNPQEALLVLQFLYEELGDIARQVNGPQEKELPYEPNWKTRQQMGEHPFVDWPKPGLNTP